MAVQLAPLAVHSIPDTSSWRHVELLPQLPSAYTAPSTWQLGGCVVLFSHLVLRPDTNVNAL